MGMWSERAGPSCQNCKLFISWYIHWFVLLTIKGPINSLHAMFLTAYFLALICSVISYPLDYKQILF